MDLTAEKTPSKSETEAILKEAIEQFNLIAEAEQENRSLALDDMRFAMGDQWDPKIAADRLADNRPCITINRTQQMVKQVVNDMRQNRAGIKVHPTGHGATEANAKIISGLIRHIESSSSAPDHYIHAGDGAVTHGTGYFRILPEYEDNSFNQRLRIERIRNPFSVYYDLDCKAPDGSDAKRVYIVTDMSKGEFEKTYPKAEAVDWEKRGLGDKTTLDWLSQDTVRVAEYFKLEEQPDTLYALADGTTVLKSTLPAAPPPELILKSRKTHKTVCVWRKITAVDVLETVTYDIPMIPVVPVWGDEYDIEGKVYRMGIVRPAKDPQRVYNYSRTAATEQVALAPKAPFIIAEGQVEGYERLWETANVKSHAYLPYIPVTISGQSVPPPQRQSFTGIPAGSMADLNLASDEIKAVTGIYDAALGNRSNEVSGKAILARQREADNATFHYVDNLNKAIRHCGRILVRFIPLIYDTPRTVRILGEDGKESMVAINQQDPLTNTPIYDVTSGEYDVVIQSGPSYETKRIEASNSMMEFMQAVPSAAPMVADLIAKAMDWPGADQIARRLKAMLPPQVLAADEEVPGQSKGPQIPPQMQAKMEEMGQVIQQLQQAMQQSMEEKADMEQKLKDQSDKLAIEKFKAETERMQVMPQILGTDQEEPSEGVEAPEPQDEAILAALQDLQESIQLLAQGMAAPAPVAPTPPPAPQMLQPIINVTVERDGNARKDIAIRAPSGETYLGSVTESMPE